MCSMCRLRMRTASSNSALFGTALSQTSWMSVARAVFASSGEGGFGRDSSGCWCVMLHGGELLPQEFEGIVQVFGLDHDAVVGLDPVAVAPVLVVVVGPGVEKLEAPDELDGENRPIEHPHHLWDG